MTVLLRCCLVGWLVMEHAQRLQVPIHVHGQPTCPSVQLGPILHHTFVTSGHYFPQALSEVLFHSIAYNRFPAVRIIALVFAMVCAVDARSTSKPIAEMQTAYGEQNMRQLRAALTDHLDAVDRMSVPDWIAQIYTLMYMYL